MISETVNILRLHVHVVMRQLFSLHCMIFKKMFLIKV